MVTRGVYGAETLGEGYFYEGQELSDGQFEVGYGSTAFKFGEGTSFLIMNPADVFSADVRSQDQPRLGKPGAVAGYDLAGPRQIVLQGMIRGTSVADLMSKIETWKQVFAPVQAGSVPLRWKMKGVANRFLVFGRPRRFQVNESTMGARYVRFVQEFVCHDPRLYEDVLNEQTIETLPTGGSFLAKRDPHVYLPGQTGNYLRTARAAATGTITTLDVRVQVGLRDWTPSYANHTLAARWMNNDPSDVKRMWRFYINGSSNMVLQISGDGGSTTQTFTSANDVSIAVSGSGLSNTDWQVRWLRVKLTGAAYGGNATATFYYSTSQSYTSPSDGSGDWTLIDTPASQNPSYGIWNDQVVDLCIGAIQNYNAVATDCAAMRVYAAYVAETGGSGVIANMAVNSDGTFTDSVTANNWLIESSGVSPLSAEFRNWSLTQPWDSRDTPDVAGTVEPICTVYQPATVTKSWEGGSYLSLPGTSGAYAYTADSSTLTFNNGVDLRARVSMNWQSYTIWQVLVAKWNSTGSNNRGFIFSMSGTSVGRPQFYLSWDGTNQTLLSATDEVPFADGAIGWVRVVYEPSVAIDDVLPWVSSSSTANNVSKTTFYTSLDGERWERLGDPVIGTATTGLYDSTARMTVGAYQDGGTSNPLTGRVYYVEARDPTTGRVGAAPSFDSLYAGTTSITDLPGNTWTVAGAAAIVGSPAGTADTPLMIQLNGPMTNPRLRDNVTGTTLYFDGLDLSKHWDEEVFIKDEFVLADGTSLGGRTPAYRASGYPTSGTTWVALNSTWEADGNAARQKTQTANKNNLLYLLPDSTVGSVNGYIEVDCKVASALHGLLFRYYHGASSGYVLRYESNGSIKLYSFTADTGESNWTNVATVINASWRSGQRLRIEFVKQLIRVYIDNEVVMSYVDTVRSGSTTYRGVGFAGTSTGTVPSGAKWSTVEFGLIDVSADPDEVVLNCDEHSVEQNGTINVRKYLSVVGEWPVARKGLNSFTFGSDSLTNKPAATPVRFWYRKAFI